MDDGLGTSESPVHSITTARTDCCPFGAQLRAETQVKQQAGSANIIRHRQNLLLTKLEFSFVHTQEKYCFHAVQPR